ncbi:alpha/beta hydrolase [Nocardiopsis rhodophaea]
MPDPGRAALVHPDKGGAAARRPRLLLLLLTEDTILMRSLLSRRFRATRAVTAATAVLALASVTGQVAHADTPAVPEFDDGFGLSQVTEDREVHSSTDFSITVTTPEVAGQHKIRIFLPSDYASEPGKRWPVTYFLHGGPGNPDEAGTVEALRSDQMITVAPDGGRKGWYADWLMQDTAEGAANWETFHLEQVVPLIDANLRTIPDRGQRAVVGLSMGGFGSMHYAQTRPDLFGHVASMSGGIDFGNYAVRGAVVATELNLTTAWCAVSSSRGCADYGPVVDSDAIFGSPYPVFNADHIWRSVNPAASANLAKLADTGITLYTGDNDLVENHTADGVDIVTSRLDKLGIPSRAVNYGDGSSLSPTCNGGHNYGCWAPAFADYIPRLEAAFAAEETK